MKAYDGAPISARRFSALRPLGAALSLSLLLSRHVVSFGGQRFKRRLVALFLVSRPEHGGGVDAIIDLNQSVDSSVDASRHACKIRSQPPISNGREAKNNSN